MLVPVSKGYGKLNSLFLFFLIPGLFPQEYPEEHGLHMSQR